MRPKNDTRRKTVSVLELAADRPRGVDRRGGVIFGAKILSLRSRNGPRYAPEALKRAAGLYEGSQVFIGHPERERPDAERNPSDMIGWLRNVRTESDGLRGDLHFVKAHPMAGVLAEVAERNPAALGLSHNAVVVESTHGDEVVYESISRVRSVDLVCRPATTRGIFESQQSGGAATMGKASMRNLILARIAKVLDGDASPVEKVKRIEQTVKELLEVDAKVLAISLAASQGRSDPEGQWGTPDDIAVRSATESRRPSPKASDIEARNFAARLRGLGPAMPPAAPTIGEVIESTGLLPGDPERFAGDLATCADALRRPGVTRIR